MGLQSQAVTQVYRRSHKCTSLVSLLNVSRCSETQEYEPVLRNLSSNINPASVCIGGDGYMSSCMARHVDNKLQPQVRLCHWAMPHCWISSNPQPSSEGSGLRWSVPFGLGRLLLLISFSKKQSSQRRALGLEAPVCLTRWCTTAPACR